MRKFSTLMLAIVSMSMICGFICGIQYTVRYAEIYVTPEDVIYMQIAGQVYAHEAE